MTREPFAIDWRAFFELYRPMALRFARGLTGDEATAEDLLQEAARELFERVRDGRLALDSAAHLRNYYFRAVRNRAVSALRRAGRARIAEGDPERGAAPDPGPAELAAAGEAGRMRALILRDLEAALAALRPEERDALRLRYGDGLAFREIAERTGTSISTLHARVEAGLAKIRKSIGKRWGDAY
jgi:RNA polymerase sigma-70 factor (ECF subfamily)